MAAYNDIQDILNNQMTGYEQEQIEEIRKQIEKTKSYISDPQMKEEVFSECKEILEFYKNHPGESIIKDIRKTLDDAQKQYDKTILDDEKTNGEPNMDDLPTETPDNFNANSETVTMTNSQGTVAIPKELATQIESYSPELQRMFVEVYASEKEWGSFCKEVKEAVDKHGCPEEEAAKLLNDYSATNNFLDSNANVDNTGNNVPQYTRQQLLNNIMDANQDAKDGVMVDWDNVCNKSMDILNNGIKLDKIEGQDERAAMQKAAAARSGITARFGAIGNGFFDAINAFSSDDAAQAFFRLFQAFFTVFKSMMQIHNNQAKFLNEQMREAVFGKEILINATLTQAKDVKEAELTASKDDMTEHLKLLKSRCQNTQTIQEIQVTDGFTNKTHNITLSPAKRENGISYVKVTFDGKEVQDISEIGNILENSRKEGLREANNKIFDSQERLSKAERKIQDIDKKIENIDKKLKNKNLPDKEKAFLQKEHEKLIEDKGFTGKIIESSRNDINRAKLTIDRINKSNPYTTVTAPIKKLLEKVKQKDDSRDAR